MPNEDRLTRADLEKLKEAVKKNERKHISHNNEAKYYPNSKREPEKPIFDFRKKRPSPKIEPGKPPKEMPEQIKKYLEKTMGSDRSPTVTDTETGETTFGRPRKFSSGELADLIGPSKPKGSVSPKIRAYDDDVQSTLGAGVNLTTKKGVSFDFDVDKTNYKNSDYKEPESYKASVSKQGEKFSYGASGTKKGKSSRVEAGFTFKYKDGGMASCRGMGKAVKGGKFTGVK
jgi:hypothetical protein